MWQKIMKFMQMTKIKQVALVICVDNSSIKKTIFCNAEGRHSEKSFNHS